MSQFLETVYLRDANWNIVEAHIVDEMAQLKEENEKLKEENKELKEIIAHYNNFEEWKKRLEWMLKEED